MPIETRRAEIGTPPWWLGRLYERLVKERPGLIKLDRYYDGRHNLAFATERFRRAFGNQFKTFADNWCEVVVDAVEERLDITGFRIGGKTDMPAWDIWQRNMLDAESQIAHTEALILAKSFVLVWNEDERANRAQITVESAHETIVEHVPGSRWARAAALKSWHDDITGHINATLYLPDSVWKFRSDKPVDEKQLGGATEVRWEERIVEGEEFPLPNRLGVVPVVPLYNKPRLRKAAQSEIVQVIPSQDAVNKLTMDMLVASEYAGFPQRIATGVEIPKDPKTGQVINDYWKQALETFLVSGNKDAKFGTIQAADLNNYVQAIQHEVQSIASRTRTPPHYFFLRGEFPSGESIVAAEAGLVSKARRRMRHWEESWEEVMRLAFAVEGKRGKARAMDMETLWRDPESRTESQHIDATVKRKELEVPVVQLWEDAGYTPTQIERMSQLRESERAANPPPEADDQGSEA